MTRARNLKGIDQYESVPDSPQSYIAMSGLDAIPTLSVVKMGSDGLPLLATCNDADVYETVAGVKVDDLHVQVIGIIRGLPLDVGQVFLGEDGTMTNTAPNETGQTVIRIGYQSRCGLGYVLLLGISPVCRL